MKKYSKKWFEDLYQNSKDWITLSVASDTEEFTCSSISYPEMEVEFNFIKCNLINACLFELVTEDGEMLEAYRDAEGIDEPIWSINRPIVINFTK